MIFAFVRSGIWHDCNFCKLANCTRDNRRTQLYSCVLLDAMFYSWVLFQNGVDSRALYPGASSEGSIGSVATRISIRYIGMHKQHIGIVFSGGKTNSVRRNGLIKIAQQGATAFLCGRDKAQLKKTSGRNWPGRTSLKWAVRAYVWHIYRAIFSKLKCDYNENFFYHFCWEPQLDIFH